MRAAPGRGASANRPFTGRWTRRLTLSLIVVAFVVGAPMTGLVLVGARSDSSLAGVTFDAAPVMAAPVARDITDEKVVKVVPSWAPGVSLLAPAWSGLVTSVAAKPGAELKSGDEVATISGVRRVAFASAQPFYRPIASGDEGEDVAELHRLLVAMGALDQEPADPAVATFATTVGIRALAKSLGVAGTVSTFDPGWVVWLPSDPFPLGSLKLQVGQPAPPAGTAIGEAQASLTAASVASLNQEPLSLDPGAAWVLTVGKTTVDIDPATLTVSKEGLAALAPALPPPSNDPNNSATGTIRRKTALHTLGIAATAIQSNSAGALCAWVADGTSYRAVAVKIASSRAGVTNVSEGLTGDSQVLVNPAAVMEHPECP